MSNIIFLLVACFILSVGAFLTWRHRFIQFRMLPQMVKLFIAAFSKKESQDHTIKAHHALFVAMSTTIGIATIVGPVIAIRLGGPGIVVGFILGTFLGAAINFTEVKLAIRYRKLGSNSVGGPMRYLSEGVFPLLGKIYAVGAVVLLAGWSAAQANQLAAILNSSFLGDFHVSKVITGSVLSVSVITLLVGGIKKIAYFSSKLVPTMFVLYVCAGLWIVALNYKMLPSIFAMIFTTCFKPMTLATGATLGGIVGSLRWGVLKALHMNEAGVGTQAIPHSSADCTDPTSQGILAMAATYTAGFLAVLSSLITLITKTWLDPDLALGLDMVVSSFTLYFSKAGVVVVILSAVLFGYGTILGNSYNGFACMSHLSEKKFFFYLYYLLVAGMIYWGACSDTQSAWSMVDYLVIPVVISHLFGLFYLEMKTNPISKKVFSPGM